MFFCDKLYKLCFLCLHKHRAVGGGAGVEEEEEEEEEGNIGGGGGGSPGSNVNLCQST